MEFPGRLIKKIEAASGVTLAIREALTARGIEVDSPDVGFDEKLEASVKLFQTRNSEVVPVFWTGC
jgi:hypothetical protein